MSRFCAMSFSICCAWLVELDGLVADRGLRRLPGMLHRAAGGLENGLVRYLGRVLRNDGTVGRDAVAVFVGIGFHGAAFGANRAVAAGAGRASDGGGAGSRFLRGGAVRDNDGSVRPAASAHGFRSSFATWCRPEGIERDRREFALAHREGSAIMAACARDDLLEKRCPVMQDWADHISARAGQVIVADPGIGAAILGLVALAAWALAEYATWRLWAALGAGLAAYIIGAGAVFILGIVLAVRFMLASVGRGPSVTHEHHGALVRTQRDDSHGTVLRVESWIICDGS